MLRPLKYELSRLHYIIHKVVMCRGMCFPSQFANGSQTHLYVRTSKYVVEGIDKNTPVSRRFFVYIPEHDTSWWIMCFVMLECLLMYYHKRVITMHSLLRCLAVRFLITVLENDQFAVLPAGWSALKFSITRIFPGKLEIIPLWLKI